MQDLLPCEIMQSQILIQHTRYVGVISVHFSCSPTSIKLGLHTELVLQTYNEVSANQQISKNRASLDLVMFIGNAYLLISQLNT